MQDWSKELAPWANTPWQLTEVLDKVIKDKVSIAIYVPYYTNAVVPKGLSLLEKHLTIIPNKENTFPREGKKVCGKTPWGQSLVGKIGPSLVLT